MAHQRFWLLTLIFVLSSIRVGSAQAPTSRIMPFYGYLAGQPDGFLDLRLRLFPTAAGGSHCFEETQTIYVAGELFFAYIGNGTPTGIPAAPCFTTNPSLWIGFALDATPDVEIGHRTPIVAAGYAFKAINADQASQAANALQFGSIPPSGFVQTTGGSMSASNPAAILTVTNVSPSSGTALAAESRSAQGVAGIFSNTGGGDLLQGKDRTGTTVFRLLNNGEAHLAAIMTAGGINTGTQYNIGGQRVVSIPGRENVFVGVAAGQNNTLGYSNAFFGTRAGQGNTAGDANAFFGVNAGASNSTGRENAFFGTNAGTNNTIGPSNAFFGTGAGALNTTGGTNAFFGMCAGTGNTTGGANAFFGYCAGGSNTSGGNNAFFGTEAGQYNTTGGNNDFFGYRAGRNNSTGFHNAFFGHTAGLNNNLGSENAFFGTGTGAGNTTGSYNCFYGTNTGTGNGTGQLNAFFGHSAGWSNTTENNNTFIGALSNGAPGITNATALGANAVVRQSNSVVLGNNASVGVGTSAPKAKLHVQEGHVLVGSPGAGIILKSPNGATCRLLTIDNVGTMVLAPITCP